MNLSSILNLGGALTGGNPAEKLHKAAQVSEPSQLVRCAGPLATADLIFMLCACQVGDVDKVLGLLQAQPALLEHRGQGDSDGFTVLHEAVALAHTELLAALLRHCAAISPQQLKAALEARDARGRTPGERGGQAERRTIATRRLRLAGSLGPVSQPASQPVTWSACLLPVAEARDKEGR